MKNFYGALVIIAVAVALGLGVVNYVRQVPVNNNGEVRFGAAGNMVAEDYIPYVMYNEGYNSNKPIATASTLNVTGATALTGALSAGAGTFTGALTASAQSTLASTSVSGLFTVSAPTLAYTMSTTIATYNSLTAAQVLNYRAVALTLGNTTTASLVIPTVQALKNAGLAVNMHKYLTLYNTETASTSVIQDAETSSTIKFSDSATLDAGDDMICDFWLYTATALRVLCTNIDA
jgi:hypothetical protein